QARHRESARYRKWLDDNGIDLHSGKPRKEGTGADDDQDAPKPSGKCADTGKNDDPDEDDGGVTAEQVTAHVRRAVDRATLAPVALQAPARALRCRSRPRSR